MLAVERPQHNIGYMSVSSHPRLPTLQQYYGENKTSNSVSFMQPSADHHVQKSGLVFIQTNSQKKLAARAKVYNNKLDHYIILSSKSFINSLTIITKNKKICAFESGNFVTPPPPHPSSMHYRPTYPQSSHTNFRPTQPWTNE